MTDIAETPLSHPDRSIAAAVLRSWGRNAAVPVIDRARRAPLSVATSFQGIERSYAEVGESVATIAGRLHAMGVSPGDRVGFVSQTGPAIIDHLLATLSLGAVFVPLNSLLAPGELLEIVEDAGCRVLIADRSLAEHLELVREQLDAKLVMLSDGAEPPSGWADDEGLPAIRAPEPIVDTEPDDAAILMYTSGTTGRPKGVIISHRNVIAATLDLSTTIPFTPTGALLTMTPIFHVAALALAIATIGAGGRIVILPAFGADAFYEALTRHRITFTFGVPAMLSLLADDPRFEETDLSDILLMCSAAPVPETLLHRYLDRGATITQGYGLTESTGCVTLLEPCMTPHKLGSAGLPYPRTEVEIRDPLGQPVPTGVDGEIWARGDAMVRGYWNRPEETAALHDEAGWMRTGDAGHLDEDGHLRITDRIKDMIISGGENVYPAQVEKVLAGHPDIAEVAVIGTPDERWGEAVTAIVVPRGERPLELEDLRTFARPHLAGYKLPRRVETVGRLPRNASGKVQKHLLRQEHDTDDRP